MTDAAITLRPAVPSDAPLIFALIGELAAYERLSQEIAADEGMIAAALFADAPRAFCTIAEYDGAVAGFVLWFYTFSTFRGRHGIWIEDLYVREPLRGRGIGRALLMSVARRCREEKLGRLEWAVLNWNAPAIGFYEKVGAKLLRDWTMCRLDGTALIDFGGKAGTS
ncbi:MAG: GNAT family N-acetyltransferase [Methylovirgula sp.]